MKRPTGAAYHWHRRTAIALWVLFIYLLIAYVALRWNWHSLPSELYPGSD